MGRVYTVDLPATSISAGQDLFTVFASSIPACKIKRVTIKCANAAANAGQQMQFSATMLTNTSLGTGGSVIAAQRVDKGDYSAQSTFHVADTSPTTGTGGGGGAAQPCYEDGCYLFQGLDVRFEEAFFLSPGWTFVFRLVTAPSSPVYLCGTMWVEEVGGNTGTNN